MKRGRFLAIEGCDGSGKGEQARRLAIRIAASGRPVFLTSEPTDGPVGVLIRSYLRKAVDLADAALPALFSADRSDHCTRGIGPALDEGDVVVCDRYSLSNLAYRAAEAEGPFYCCAVCGWVGEPGEALPLGEGWLPLTCPRCLVAPVAFSGGVAARVAWARQLDVGTLVPDLTIVLTLPAELAAVRRRRRGTSAEVYEVDRIQARCAAFYARAGEHEGVGAVAVVDARGSIDEVAALVWAAAAAVLERRGER